MPPEAVGDRLAIRVICMGWSWAPWIAQACAESVIESVPQLMSDRVMSEIDDDIDDDDVSSGIGLDDDPSHSKQADCRYKFLRHMESTLQFF